MMEETEDSDRKLDMNNSSTSLDKYVGKGRNSKYMTLLPEDFEPGEMDVLCGRGKRCFNSPVSAVQCGTVCWFVLDVTIIVSHYLRLSPVPPSLLSTGKSTLSQTSGCSCG
jgi:hypothetical protein